MKLRSYFERFRNQKLLVLGLGVSNRPLVRLLLSFGLDVTCCDRTPREKLADEVLELEKLGAKLHVGGDYLDGLRADVVFRTPGMLPTRPEIRALAASGALITSEMEIFFEACPCMTIAVTGSDGKTTTTTLISELLKAAGRRVFLGGNIGTPLLPLCDEMTEDDIAVVELSSFQLMDMRRSPHIALITNLAPNHLDMHTDMAEYVAAKQNVYRWQGREDVLILNADNALTASMAPEAAGETRFFSRLTDLPRGVCLRDGWICRNGEPVLEASEILLPGVHNVENYMAAISAVDGLVPDACIRRVARSFGGVAHRIELVRVQNGVSWYNDSIASSPSRTIAGLRSFPEKVILIAGGYDKQIPYAELGPEICAHVKTLVLTGATGPRIREATVQAAGAGSMPEILECDSFEAAVYTAAAAAKPGDVVLLSPASASFDRFRDFVERGNVFKEIVNKL